MKEQKNLFKKNLKITRCNSHHMVEISIVIHLIKIIHIMAIRCIRRTVRVRKGKQMDLERIVEIKLIGE